MKVTIDNVRFELMETSKELPDVNLSKQILCKFDKMLVPIDIIISWNPFIMLIRHNDKLYDVKLCSQFVGFLSSLFPGTDFTKLDYSNYYNCALEYATTVTIDDIQYNLMAPVDKLANEVIFAEFVHNPIKLREYRGSDMIRMIQDRLLEKDYRVIVYNSVTDNRITYGKPWLIPIHVYNAIDGHYLMKESNSSDFATPGPVSAYSEI